MSRLKSNKIILAAKNYLADKIISNMLSKYASKRWFNIPPHLFMQLTLGNFKILKIMNLASHCRYPLWFPLLCRKWVWL